MARQISVALARPGMCLARPIYDEKGRVLLQSGVTLTEYHVKRLRQQFAVLTIEDEVSQGIMIPEVIAGEFRVEMQKTLEEEWTRLRAQASFKRISFNPAFAKKVRTQMRALLQIMQHTEMIQENMASLAGYDNGTYVHSVNVAIYSLILGVSLGLSENMLIELALGAMFHDMGKMLIPLDILNKRGPLTVEEYHTMKEHATLGYDLLKQQHEFSFLVARCAHEHHERLNASGYPRGLKSDQIHQFAKIIAIADVYDAMIMHRPYRDGMSPGDVMEYLFSRAGVEFDFQMVELFGKRVVPYPIGTEVQLSNGCIGIVGSIHELIPSRPVIRILEDPDQRRATPYEVDLSKQLNITVLRCQSVSLLEEIE